MELILTMEGETLETTWESFVADNDLADPDYAEWRNTIEAALNSQGVYYGGGGAQPEYALAVKVPKENFR